MTPRPAVFGIRVQRPKVASFHFQRRASINSRTDDASQSPNSLRRHFPANTRMRLGSGGFERP